MPEQMISHEDQMMQWITSKWITKPISIVSELGIADLLQDGPKSVRTLAKETNTHPPTLYRILRALSAVGIFIENKSQEFSVTPLGECLCSTYLRPIARMFLSEWHDKAWNGLNHAVRTGELAFDNVFGKSSFEWFEENPAERSILDQGQGSKAEGFVKSVLKIYDFSNFKSICDIGGGQGVFLISLLKEYPDICGYIVDLPGSVSSSEKLIENANLCSRCKAITYDFHRETPPHCDAYFLVNILHDWEDKICVKLLKNITKVMDSDTKLWIIEYVLEPEPGFSIAKLLDIEVLVMSGGRERSIAEFKNLLGMAGLEVSRIIPIDRGPAMIECTKIYHIIG